MCLTHLIWQPLLRLHLDDLYVSVTVCVRVSLPRPCVPLHPYLEFVREISRFDVAHAYACTHPSVPL